MPTRASVWIVLAAALAPPVSATEAANAITLKSLHFAPAAINTASAPAQVTVDVEAADNVSGLNYLEVVFVDASGVRRQPASARFAPASALVKSVVVTFPRAFNSDGWRLSHVFLSDAGGNTLVINSDELETRGFATRIEVTSPKDILSPRLTALEFSPGEIDTSAGPAHLDVNYSATDDFSGVSHMELTFRSPSGVATIGHTIKLDPAQTLSSSVKVTFPRFSEAGRWALSLVFLADAAGNTLVLNTEALASLGFPTTLDVKSANDTTSPKLTSLRFTPVIETAQHPAAVEVQFSATDDLSGVKSVEVGFTSPSGNETRNATAHFSPARELNGSVIVSFPAISEVGEWTLRIVLLTDAAGNTQVVDAEALSNMKLPSTLQVR